MSLDFYSEYGSVDSKFPCWVSHMDPAIILTDIDLKKLKVSQDKYGKQGRIDNFRKLEI